ncbi:MAG: hypothetical protein AB7S70_02985 [Hyphomicrobium sp.]|uniref:hypothetical protein n=1 Tax=Hyphomicrobium sp. TaxID=82 RepID=UPI003D0D2101
MRDGCKIALNATAVVAVLLAAATHPAAGGDVLVISPPWLGHPDALAVIAAADGRIVGGAATNAIAVGRSDDPAFVSRLYGSGALLVWNARFAGCGARS